MEISLPVKTPIIIISLLIILILTGGCIVSKEVAPANQGPLEIDAWCEIQEFNLTLIYNQTIVPVTEEDLKPFPEFGIYMHDGNDTLPAGNYGTRVVKVIDCNATRAMQFFKLYRKFEEFPNQPVLEYRGHYYKVGYEYLQSHSTARPTIPEPSPSIQDTTASDSGLVIVMEKTDIPLNSTLEFYLENHGPLMDEFTSGYPFSVEYYGNSGWTHVAGRGGTHGFWKLEVGEKSRRMVWNTATVREYFAEGLINRSDVRETGRFRICVQAFVGGYTMNNEVQGCKEFIVTP